jgi:hypothetical protein
MLPVVVQVKGDVTKEEGEQKNDDDLDENETRKQRTVEVGGQLACCPNLLFN